MGVITWELLRGVGEQSHEHAADCQPGQPELREPLVLSIWHVVSLHVHCGPRLTKLCILGPETVLGRELPALLLGKLRAAMGDSISVAVVELEAG